MEEKEIGVLFPPSAGVEIWENMIEESEFLPICIYTLLHVLKFALKHKRAQNNACKVTSALYVGGDR